MYIYDNEKLSQSYNIVIDKQRRHLIFYRTDGKFFDPEDCGPKKYSKIQPNFNYF